MQPLPQQSVGPDAQLFVDRFGRAILYLQPTPVRNGDVLVTDDIGATKPIWRPLEIRQSSLQPPRQVLECRDPNAFRHLVLHFDGKVVRIDGIEHHPQPIAKHDITALPFPGQRLLSRVLENETTGTRIAYYRDPNVSPSRAAWVRVGQQGRPADWRWEHVTGIFSNGWVVETRVGTLDLRAGLWRNQLMEELSPCAHGLPQEDEWGAPLQRTWGANSTWALLALVALILGIVLGVALGSAL